MRQKSVALVSLLFATSVFAEQRWASFDPGTLSLRLGTTQPSIPIVLESTDSSSSKKRLDFQQNPSSKLGAGADFWPLGFFLTFKSLEPDLSATEYGHTDYYDLQFHLSLFNRFGVDLYLQDFKGYYQSDTSPVVLRPDLQSTSVGMNFIYLLSSDRISFAAGEQLTALQNSSGGSWLLMASSFRQRFKSDATLAPTGQELDFGVLGNTREANFTTWSLGGGYAYNWVFASHWTLFATLALSLGPQWQEIQTQSYGAITEVRPSARSNGRLTIGYCGEEFFIGVSGITDTTLLQVDNQTLDFSAVYAFAFLGLRLDLL